MSLYVADFSDHNNGGADLTPAYVTRHGTPDLVILKLYPSGWTARAVRNLAGQFPLGFYMADVAPTWATAKAVLGDLGFPPGSAPLGVDLHEMGFSDGYIATQIDRAQADGQPCGHYESAGVPYRSNGAVWRWVAQYNGQPDQCDVAFDLHQWNAIHDGDGPWGDQSWAPGTLAEFMALATKEVDDVLTKDAGSALSFVWGQNERRKGNPRPMTKPDMGDGGDHLQAGQNGWDAEDGKVLPPVKP